MVLSHVGLLCLVVFADLSLTSNTRITLQEKKWFFCYLLCIVLSFKLTFRYYVLCAIDYAYNYFFIKNSFIIGSLPAVFLSSSFNYRDPSIPMLKNSERHQNVTLEIMSIDILFYTYSYKLTISAEVKGKPVSYTFVKPVGSYFKDTGVLVSKIIEDDCAVIMETFRGMLHDAAVKKEN